MNVLTINPQNCSAEEYQELIGYLEANCWNYSAEDVKTEPSLNFIEQRVLDIIIICSEQAYFYQEIVEHIAEELNFFNFVVEQNINSLVEKGYIKIEEYSDYSIGKIKQISVLD